MDAAGRTQTLQTLGLLATGAPGGKCVEALGFEDGALPAFALPPRDLTQLRIVFGSCRRRPIPTSTRWSSSTT